MPESDDQGDARDSQRLARLLRPRSVAVVGGLPAERVVEQCDRLGFEGPIWPVHPVRETLAGRPCLRSIAQLPGVPDAAYVAVNRELSIEVVAALSRLGCGGAVCYAAGFDEVAHDGRSAGLQAQLVDAAGDMPIIGPNCYGFVNLPARVALWPDQHGAAHCERGVAIITQSSNIAISLSMQTRGLPVACLMTAGNQAQTGLSELALAALADPAVTALGLHVEGLDDRDAFARLADRARALGKPVVVLKVGKSAYAQRTAMTHTASLAGSSAVFRAFAARLGIAAVDSLEQLCETLKILHGLGPLPGRRVLSLSCSGGEAALMADALAAGDLLSPELPENTMSALQRHAGEVVTVSNPFDYNTFVWGDWPRLQALYAEALRAPVDVTLLVLDLPRADRCDISDWEHALDAWLNAVDQTGANACVVATLGENLPERTANRLFARGVVPLAGIEAAVAAISAAASVGIAWKDPPQPAAAAFARNAPVRSEPLDEWRSKQLLASRGVPVPRGERLSPECDPAGAVARIGTPRFARKGLGIAHKSEAGAVCLDLADVEAIRAAMAAMPTADGHYLLEAMVDDRTIAELLVGVTRDPTIGLALTIGAGGVLAELLADTVTLILPTTAAEIGKGLASLRVHALLTGFRGRPAADLDDVIETVLRIASVALHEPVLELDVNPLMVTTTHCVAADALVVLDGAVRER